MFNFVSVLCFGCFSDGLRELKCTSYLPDNNAAAIQQNVFIAVGFPFGFFYYSIRPAAEDVIYQILLSIRTPCRLFRATLERYYHAYAMLDRIQRDFVMRR